MSRFSRNTASGLGYLLFAAIGGSCYWFFKNDHSHAEQLAAAERSKISLPVALGSSLDCATELSAVITPNRFDDPVVNLSASQVPTWAASKSIDDLDNLVSIPASQQLPSEYPHGHIQPLSVPRRGNAIVREPKTTVLSLAPQPVKSLSQSHKPERFSNAPPLVPIGNGLSAPQPIANPTPKSSDTAATETWQTKGMKMFEDIGRTLMNPPPQSTIPPSSSMQRVVLSRRPVVHSDVQPASALNATGDRSLPQPPPDQSKFIVQPIN